jgi:nucleoside 2-deoxyribosyltransferase
MDTVTAILRRHDYEVARTDHIASGTEPLIKSVLDQIQGASLVIVDVTGASPNTWYELGFAHAMRKPTVLLANREETPQIPTDLTGQLFVPYRQDQISSLEKALHGVLREQMAEIA